MERLKRYVTHAQKELADHIHTMDEREAETNLQLLDKLEAALQKDLLKFRAKHSKAIGRQKRDPILKRIRSLQTDLRLIVGQRHLQKERLEKHQQNIRERTSMKNRERRKWHYSMSYHGINDIAAHEIQEIIETLRRLGVYRFSAEVKRKYHGRQDLL